MDQVIQRCLDGDQAAWETIVRTHWRRVFNIAYKFVGRHDQAEDLTQDVFLKLYKSLETFDRRANFQTWLISVSRNLCIDHYRAVRKERETINRDVDPADHPPISLDTRADTKLELRDRVALLRKALEKLAPTLRTAVMNAMVAAHPTYPFGTVIRVTNLANGRIVQVRVIDRGPARGPRADGVLIDLSYGAAGALGFIRNGRTRVRLEVLRWGN